MEISQQTKLPEANVLLGEIQLEVALFIGPIKKTFKTVNK